MTKRCTNGHYYDGDRFAVCPHCGSADIESAGSEVTMPIGAVGGGVENIYSSSAMEDDDMKTVKLDQPAAPAEISDDEKTLPLTPPAAEAADGQPAFEQVPAEPVPQPMFRPEPLPQPQPMPVQQFMPPQPVPPFMPPQPMPPQVPPAMPPQTYQNGMAQPQGIYGGLINDAAANPVQMDDNPTVSMYGTKLRNEPTVGWLVGLNGVYQGGCFELRSGKNFIGRNPDMDIVLAADNTVSRFRHAVVLFEPHERVFIAQPGESRELFYINGKVVLSNQKLEPYDKLTIGNTKLMFFPLCSADFSWDDIETNE